MTIAAKSTLRIQQGATFRKRYVWATYPYEVEVRNGVVYKKDTASRAPIADRQIVDLTGCTGRVLIRGKTPGATPYLTLTTENEGLEFGGVEGTIDFYISDEDTTTVEIDTGIWDIEVMHPDGTVSIPLYGDALTRMR